MFTVPTGAESNQPSAIDLAENIAEIRRWDMDRTGKDAISLIIEGGWKTYNLSMNWDASEEVLQLFCCYELEAPNEQITELNKVLQRVNDEIWLGSFGWWRKEKWMVYRYGLTLSGGAAATVEQVDEMLRRAVENCERYYPVISLVANGDAICETAWEAALLEVVGSA